jgi:hypothetical protein
VGAPDELVADVEPDPQTGADVDVGETARAGARTGPVLGQGRQVDVVVDQDRGGHGGPEDLGRTEQSLGERRPGQGDDLVGARVHRVGDRHADGPQRPVRLPDLPYGVADQRAHRVGQGVHVAGGPGGPREAVPDLAGQIGRPCLDAGLVQLEREDPARGRTERVVRADPSAPSGLLLAAGVQQAGGDEAADGLGDGGFRDAGGDRELGPGDLPGADHVVEQQPVGGLPQHGLGQGSSGAVQVRHPVPLVIFAGPDLHYQCSS